jgi:hypothetical protein
LDHDSYINCSRVIDEIPEKEIKRQIGTDLSRIKRELTKTTKQEVIRAVRTAKTISRYVKSVIIQALQAK